MKNDNSEHYEGGMITQKPRMLCVDDEPANIRLLEAALLPGGYEVISAGNGKEALEKIAEHRIDAVLLDVMMPGLDGFETCRMIKANEKFRHLPVIMITALRSTEDRIKGIEAGAEDFISKPFDKAEVLARIRMLLRVKDLNDRLSSAYNNINSLVRFGEDIVRTFNPLAFDFMTVIDGIVNRIIRLTSDAADKPRMVLVGIAYDRDYYKWHKYESVLMELNRTLIGIDPSTSLDTGHNHSGRTTFSNQADIEKSGFAPLAKRLHSIQINITNIVAYLSPDFCILALNYGRDVSEHDAAVLSSIVMQGLFLKSLSAQVGETEGAFEYAVHALARASEANDEDTGNHVVRVGEYCALIAGEMGMSEGFVKSIRLQAQLHDVGKVHTPSEILKKPGKLTPEEIEVIRQHSSAGAKIIGDHPRLMIAKNIALTHHERWDGSGYPLGLKGVQIPIESRILNLADQYDALRNPRVYKPGLDHETTYKIIIEGDGRTMPGHFDPDVLMAFRETHQRFREIYEHMQ